MEIGVRELRQHASRWLARVKAGETIVVTERGRPVAMLSQFPSSLRGRLEIMIEDGRAKPAEGELLAVLAAAGGPTVGPPLTDVLQQNRSDER